MCVYVILHFIHMRFVLASNFSVLRFTLILVSMGVSFRLTCQNNRDIVIYVYFIWIIFFSLAFVYFVFAYLHEYSMYNFVRSSTLVIIFSRAYGTQFCCCWLQLLYNVGIYARSNSPQIYASLHTLYTFAKIVA